VLVRLERELLRADGVLICDINKGLLTPALMKVIIERARRQGKPVIVDPRTADDLSIYRGASALTPNRYETERATGQRFSAPETWHPAARRLIDDLGLDACLVTLDRDGMFLAGRDGFGHHIRSAPREVYDVTGAGDVVLAMFGLSFSF
jgi:D-beta-D-heptose 7-phosphate kinase/D-beta-D-heptose 1-phosphate adenosyltransferase